MLTLEIFGGLTGGGEVTDCGAFDLKFPTKSNKQNLEVLVKAGKGKH